MRRLDFDVDLSQLMGVVNELSASEKQVNFALSRALNRTAGTLRVRSSKILKDKLELRRVSALRKRLKTLKLRMGKSKRDVRIWFGLNDMPISWFKGTPKQTASGAVFRGRNYPNAFVARSSYAKQKTIMKRVGRERLSIEEQLFPVEDRAQNLIEDHVLDGWEEFFWKEFRRDLAARVRYNIGEK